MGALPCSSGPFAPWPQLSDRLFLLLQLLTQLLAPFFELASGPAVRREKGTP
jgi:hypothetical protein